jgi:hypothetical protein
MRHVCGVRAAVFALVCAGLGAAPAVVRGQDRDSAEVRRARKMVEAEKELILFFAHPAAEFQTLRYDGAKELRDGGYSVTYTFNWHSPLTSGDYSTELTFVCDRTGKLDFIRAGDTSSLIPPFLASNTVVNLVKREVQKDPKFQDDRALMRLLEKDAKAILETYLRRDIEALSTLLRAVTR